MDVGFNMSAGSSGGSMGSGGRPGLKKGPWTSAEDAMLVEYVKKHGEGNWNALQKNSGLLRCGKSCRLRWANHLQPNLKRGAIISEEEKKIIELHAQMGNKWARMATHAIDLRSFDVLGVPQVKVCKSLRVITANEMDEDAMLENNESYPSDLLFDESVSKEGQMPDDGNILSVCSPSEGVLPVEPFMVPAERTSRRLKNKEFMLDTNQNAFEFEQHRQSTPHQKNSFPGDPNALQSGKSTEKCKVRKE